MDFRLKSVGISIFLLADLSISTYCTILHYKNQSSALFPSLFSPFSSVVDLLSLFLLRVSCIAYISWIRFKNLPETGYENRFRVVQIVFLVLCPIKLLLLDENHTSGIPVWNVVFVVWTMISLLGAVLYSRRGQDGYERLRDDSFSILWKLLRNIFTEWKLNLVGISSLVTCAIANIFIPYYVSQVVTTVIRHKSYPELNHSVLIYAALGIVASLAAGLRASSFEFAHWKLFHKNRLNLYSSYLSQETGFFDTNRTGDLLSRMTSDIQSMTDTISRNMNTFCRNFIPLIGSVVFMMFLSWRLTLLYFVLLPVIFFLCRYFGEIHEKLFEAAQDETAKTNIVGQEVISSMRTVRSFAAESMEAERFLQKINETVKVWRRVAAADAGFIWLTEGVNTCMVISVMWYGGHLVLQSKMPSELLLSFLVYQMRTSDNLVQMSDVFDGLMKTIGASRKVFDHIERVPEILHLGTKKPEEFQGTIEFRNVSFTYPSRPLDPILKNVSFTVPAGATVALVGASGSGKSSIILLLSGFYRPSSGLILIDGIPLDELDRDHLHKQMALVRQEPTLFAYSIMENIRYGVDCSDEECIFAAELANADGFIRELPNQYDSNAGECGGLLSGGQKQRVAIARAIVRKPQMLLLDEATSALDCESERAVQESLEDSMFGKTILVVAHRLSTVQNADQIIVMDKGEIVQVGIHEELKLVRGMYKRLLKHQMQEEDGWETPILTAVGSRATGPRLRSTPIRFSPSDDAAQFRKSL